MKPAGNTFTSSFFRLWGSARDQAKSEQSATMAMTPAMPGTSATRGGIDQARSISRRRFAMTADVMLVT
jgi:hypothetical protein